MNKKVLKNLAYLTFFAIALCAHELATETLTLTTYYPAPYGVYTQLRATQNSFLAYQGGNVGVGTTLAARKLHVKGGNVLVDDGNADDIGIVEIFLAEGITGPGVPRNYGGLLQYDATNDRMRVGTRNLAGTNMGISIARESGGMILQQLATNPPAVSPQDNGMMYYNTTNNKFYGYDGAWKTFSGGNVVEAVFQREIHNVKWGTSIINMGSTTNRFCALTLQRLEDIDGGGEWAQCNIDQSGGQWRLLAQTGGNCDDCDVVCQARCISW